MENYEIGDLVKHKSSSQIMVVKGFSKNETKFGFARYQKGENTSPYIVCEFLEDCNKKVLIFPKESLEKIKDNSNS
ncbi:hypothetical protein [Leptospira weilii]|uniref:hypothetical protein n=1 Tax=Leptospira weilii TaxID=28184 RepID=UPI00055AF8F6|nr:hypothetical protein [Leptospira weilii]